MRDLSKREKELLKIIISNEKCRFEDFFTPSLTAQANITFNHQESDTSIQRIRVIVKLDESEDDKIRRRRAHKLFLEIIENISLIDLLISEHYLLKLQVDMDFDMDPKSAIGTPNLKGPGYAFGDKLIKNKLEELRRFSIPLKN